MRATHNLFLKKKININVFTADLGSGSKNDYQKYIFKNKFLLDSYDLFKKDSNTKPLNLEKRFKLKKKYKCIILFNVMEHIYNKNILIKSINKSLKKNGRLELFIPFMYRFHGDPDDYVRLTHVYLEKFLRLNGFKVSTTLIATGQMNVVSEILFKYFKNSILKFLFSNILTILNKIFYYVSKDFRNYYCGVHCSCIKIK
jgi:SAM-dependent methyltransferase